MRRIGTCLSVRRIFIHAMPRLRWYRKMRTREKVLCKDDYGNKILLIKNVEFGFDLLTDGRVFLSPRLARKLAAALLKFAKENS